MPVFAMDISKKNQQDSNAAANPNSVEAVPRITITDEMFVGWNSPPNEQPNEQPNEKKGPKGVPRLSHKKSKTGCQRCRARRVKVTLLSLVILDFRYQKTPPPLLALSVLPTLLWPTLVPCPNGRICIFKWILDIIFLS
jgi:hypothetical protein